MINRQSRSQEVHPENPPELPEEQGALSIDFVSSFDFGQQFISTQDRLYYAKPQRLLNDQGVEATERAPKLCSNKRPSPRTFDEMVGN